MRRPNVLVLYTDQQRWDTIGAGGNERIHTPNLDALASKGTLFDNSFCNSPVCMPSRMSMLSGQYPSSVGVCSNGIEMPADIPCVHNILSNYDYQTANIAKLHFKNHASQYRDHRDPHPSYGFDTLILSDEPGCYDDAYTKWIEMRDPSQLEACRCDTPPAWTGQAVKKHPRATHFPYVFEGPEDFTHTAFVADETCEYIRRHKDHPFFCIAGFYAPHAPLNPPQRFVDMYDPKEMPLPHRNEGENLGDTSDDQWRKTMAYYYALISHVDDQVGRILTELETQGLEEDTIVVYTADHGEHLGDHGWVGKGSAHDSCARVPLIVRYPAKASALGRRPEIIEAVDIVPTLLDWCGVQTPPFMQGRSFSELLEGGSYEPRMSAFIEQRPARSNGYKAARTLSHLYDIESNGKEHLYDLESDPHQLTNVAEDQDHSEALHAMRHALLLRWADVESRVKARTGQY